MKFSFNSFNHTVYLGLEPTLPAQIAAAGAAGYEHIGVDIPSVLAHAEAGVTPAALLDAMAASGVTPYELNFWAILPDLDASRAGLAVALEVFDALGAEWLQSVVMGPVDDGIVAVVRDAALALADRDARLAVEYLPSYPVCSIRDVRALSDAVGPPGVAVCVDAHHFFRGPDTFDDFDALPGAELAFLQFCDALPLGDMDMGDAMVNGRAMAGEGEFPLDEFCRHAVARGYDGVVSVEILSSAWRARPLDEFVLTSLETTKSCFDRAKESSARVAGAEGTGAGTSARVAGAEGTGAGTSARVAGAEGTGAGTSARVAGAEGTGAGTSARVAGAEGTGAGTSARVAGAEGTGAGTSARVAGAEGTGAGTSARVAGAEGTGAGEVSNE